MQISLYIKHKQGEKIINGIVPSFYLPPISPPCTSPFHHPACSPHTVLMIPLLSLCALHNSCLDRLCHLSTRPFQSQPWLNSVNATDTRKDTFALFCIYKVAAISSQFTEALTKGVSMKQSHYILYIPPSSQDMSATTFPLDPIPTTQKIFPCSHSSGELLASLSSPVPF